MTRFVDHYLAALLAQASHLISSEFHAVVRANGLSVSEWRVLASFLPEGLGAGLLARSALAATFAASLELARTGKLQLRQDVTFGPIYVRSGEASDG